MPVICFICVCEIISHETNTIPQLCAVCTLAAWIRTKISAGSVHVDLTLRIRDEH